MTCDVNPRLKEVLVKRDSRMFATVTLLSLATLVLVPQQTSGHFRQEQTIQKAIRQLVSANQMEREAAKQELIQMGRNTLGPFVSFLGQAFYPTDRAWAEEQERTALVRINFDGDRWSVQVKQPRQSDHEQAHEKVESGATDEFQRFAELRDRVMGDVMEIMRHLRAEQEFIGIFARDIYDFTHSDTYDSGLDMLTGMKALMTIGPEAVPRVLEILEAADELSIASLGSQSEIPEPYRTTLIDFRSNSIRARAAVVLRKIGNKESLPALEKALESRPLDMRTASHVQAAIRSIKERAK